MVIDAFILKDFKASPDDQDVFMNQLTAVCGCHGAAPLPPTYRRLILITSVQVCLSGGCRAEQTPQRIIPNRQLEWSLHMWAELSEICHFLLIQSGH